MLAGENGFPIVWDQNCETWEVWRFERLWKIAQLKVAGEGLETPLQLLVFGKVFISKHTKSSLEQSHPKAACSEKGWRSETLVSFQLRLQCVPRCLV